MAYEKELQVARDIARKAGDIMLHYFDGDQQRVIKSDGSPVTIADTSINSLVIAELAKEFPEDGVIGEEESNTEYGMGRKWFCDPIDGTKAFTWGIPTAMFSLALVVDGRPVVGVAYDPFLNRMYTGIVGQGSSCNDQKLSVNNDGLDGGIVAMTSSVTEIVTNPVYVQKLRNAGSQLALFSGAVYKSVLVARAKTVGYFESKVNAHDMAAVEVIVAEAGGKVTGFAGEQLNYSKPFKGAVVSNGLVHDELLSSISQ